MFLEMTVSSLSVDPFTNMPVVVLKDASGERNVAIWIGLGEASAIATELEKIKLDRPMTHDLMKTVLGLCQARVERVEIHDLRDNTFYATLYIQRADGTIVGVDARPSDAIAMALRARAPIRVDEKVIARAHKKALTIELAEPLLHDDVSFDAKLETLTDGAFGKWKM